MFLGDMNFTLDLLMPSWYLDHKLGNKGFGFHFSQSSNTLFPTRMSTDKQSEQSPSIFELTSNRFYSTSLQDSFV